MYQINETHSRNAEKQHYDWKSTWDNMNATENWGTVTYLYKKYGSPNSYQDFYTAYIADTEGDNAKTHGRSEDYITYQAELFKEKTGGKEGLGVYKDYICKKLFIDTMDGLKWENKAKDWLTDKGYTVEEPDYYQDTTEGIDKLVYKDGSLYCIVQVKPHTFFIGNNNDGLIRDRKNAMKKYNTCRTKYNVPVVYFIYNRNTQEWLNNEKGGMSFNLTTLIDSNGYS